jgi:REP element-mobilizing transposase RayT
MELPQRKPNRLRGYDYSLSGAYFVTICAKDSAEIFSRISVGDGLARPAYTSVELTDIGEQIMRMVDYINQRYDNTFIDKYVIMPNHVHLILVIGNCGETGQANGAAGRNETAGRASPSPTVGNIIGGLKSGVSRNICFSPWQRFFHDHIIRDEADYNRIAEYIEQNPAKWEEDCFYGI